MTVRVSGITFIKNGLTLGYPIKESILSIDSLCDEIIINVGFDDEELTKDDGTYAYLKNAFSGEKYIFLKSFWNPDSLKGGVVLSEQTNIALKKATGKYVQYIQGDECLHEKDLELIKENLKIMDDNDSVDGLVFNYHHFYGNTDIIKRTKKTYRAEIRLIRNNRNIVSWLDAQGFRYENETKIKCLKIEAYVYHYGWCRKENLMMEKTIAFEKLYHGEKKNISEFSYERVWGLYAFRSLHPKVMTNWIQENKNEIDLLSLKFKWNFKDLRVILSDTYESLTGIRLGEYTNYIIE